MQILRPLIVIAVLGAPTTIAAQVTHDIAGTWALAPDTGNAAYVLASRGVEGNFLICFDAGNVSTVKVSSGSDNSVLTRGSCTVFSAGTEHGIVVDFTDVRSDAAAHASALGTFRVMFPQDD